MNTPEPRADRDLDALLHAGEPPLLPAHPLVVERLRRLARARTSRPRRAWLTAAAAVLVVGFLGLGRSAEITRPAPAAAALDALAFARLEHQLAALERRALSAHFDALERRVHERVPDDVDDPPPSAAPTRLHPALERRVARARAAGLDEPEALDVVRLALLARQAASTPDASSLPERWAELAARHGAAPWLRSPVDRTPR